MSAFICMPEHFGILAAHAARNGCVLHAWKESASTSIQSARIARELARENIRSVTHRYPDDKDGERPGPALKDADIEEAAAIYAVYFMAKPQGLAPVQIIKLCDCYAYQSCETEDWRDSAAYAQIDMIKDDAVRRITGYYDADWEYSYEEQIPKVDALYAKHKG